MGFWEKIQAPTTLWLWPAGQPESVYSWRLNCCRPPERRHCGGRPPAKHGLHGPCRPEPCCGLPQRKLEKTPHLCDRRGQLLWEQPNRGNREPSNPSKTWRASTKVNRALQLPGLCSLLWTKQHAAFLSSLCLKDNRLPTFLPDSENTHELTCHLTCGCLLLIFCLSWSLKQYVKLVCCLS